MKFNWGHGIVVAFALFIAFIMYSVVTAFQQNVDLVSETYYKDELVYQARIDQKSNLANSGLEVNLKQTLEGVVLEFPEKFEGAQGEIHFYHPSRELFDKHYEIALNNENQQVISKEDLIKGRFKVKINWTANDTPYFQEKEIYLQ